MRIIELPLTFGRAVATAAQAWHLRVQPRHVLEEIRMPPTGPNPVMNRLMRLAAHGVNGPAGAMSHVDIDAPLAGVQRHFDHHLCGLQAQPRGERRFELVVHRRSSVQG